MRKKDKRKARRKNFTVSIHFMIDGKLKKRLEAVARKKRQTLSSYVRELVADIATGGAL